MKITRVLRYSCPNGIDCDRIYDTDGPDLAVRGRIVDDPSELAALGIAGLPDHEGVVLIERRIAPELSPRT
ncbi:hypothetical protein [Pseudonocardia nigra]|uniref:hypothetical protein n=1 Tax=Pseudonocardia nigra TaxID=1921578 RepID=UPI001C5D041E|nr:hypothetical protein [Pseudonocardia nigra]